MKNLKKIGIIGGADPAASCLLYQNIIDACLARNDCNNGSDFPEIIIINYPFTRGMSTAHAQQSKSTLCQELQSCIDKLILCQADIIALACNTLHLYLPYLNFYGNQVIHIVETTLDHIAQTPAKRLLLLATENTIEQKLYQHPIIEFITPSKADQKEINRIITQIHKGIYLKIDTERISLITEKAHIDGIILGCTDLPVLHKRYPIRNQRPIFDTVEILAHELVKKSFLSS